MSAGVSGGPAAAGSGSWCLHGDYRETLTEEMNSENNKRHLYVSLITINKSEKNVPKGWMSMWLSPKKMLFYIVVVAST